ncbi:hypothetical protein TSUD_124820 [Trifolium subterraneum]|uniref:MADS-box domain-containing protein n=1 Tax=Trifolium subterraneum TaxID=3900 RepID=A0A2Z6LL96_TRISU|nr:hypothetical protein TSUD_124820 [Trifolium subterraneum]
MPRNKVKLAYIVCNFKRKEAFRKRKKCIMKKLKEICTLCGIEGCAIIYDNNNPEAVVWPSDLGVRSVLSRFGNYPVLERSRHVMDQSDFLRESIRKAYEKLKKQKEENRKKEMTNIMYYYIQTNEFNGSVLTKYDLDDFSSFVNENLKEIDRKMKGMQIEAQEQVGNGGEAMDGTIVHENIGHVQGLLNDGTMVHENIGHVEGLLNGANLESNMGNTADVQGLEANLEGNIGNSADVQGLEANMNYDVESDVQHLLTNFSMLPFHDDDINVDTTIFGQIGPNFP